MCVVVLFVFFGGGGWEGLCYLWKVISFEMKGKYGVGEEWG